MRNLTATMVAFLLLSCATSAWAQSDDPFGPGKSDPFDKPSARRDQPKTTSPIQRRPTNDRPSIVDQAKKVLAAGQEPIQLGPPRDHVMERRIQAALDDETSHIFVETPLSEALASISELHNIPIVSDRRALEEIGLTPETRVSLSLNNVSLRSFLRLMLRELDLTYLIKDEVLQITTAQAAEQNLILKMYVLPENLAAKSDSVIKVLTHSVVPDSWEGIGGPSSAMAIDHVLVISTTGDVQDRVKEFLAMLIEKYGK
jgi:hypothetical protein